MNIFHTTAEVHNWSLAQKKAGKRISFVPTMGALHEGHIALLREGRRLGDQLILSIYVNPMQFAPNEDLAKYPRDLDGDIKKARSADTNAVFIPSDSLLMYPEGYLTYVTVKDISTRLCGKSRPTHFTGVATVVTKLFNLIQPDVAIFGEKDFQQLVIIKKMVLDLDMPTQIVSCPIVREPDGLAMSSRNAYLSPAEREAATSLFKSLNRAEEMIAAGETDIDNMILKKVRTTIEDTGLARIDYASLVDPETFLDIEVFRRPALLALAVFIGKTRLIDNRLFP